MALSMSASLGRGVFLSNAQADMNCALWQYPHWTTSTSVHARRSASICCPCTPSMVVTSRPCTASIGVTHERTASPFRCTVQAPHNALPQPNFVPTSFNSPRSTQSSGVSGSAFTVRLLLLIESVVMVFLVASSDFQRQAAQPLSRERVHGVGDRRCNRRRARFAHTPGRLIAGYDLHLDCRALVDAKRWVVVKVALLHLTLIDGDLAVERSRQAVHDGAFHLLANQVRVHGHTAVDDALDPVHTNLFIFGQRDFGDLRNDAAEGAVDREAPRALRAVGRFAVGPSA